MRQFNVRALRVGQVCQLGISGYQCQILALNQTEARIKLLEFEKIVTIPANQLKPLTKIE